MNNLLRSGFLLLFLLCASVGYGQQPDIEKIKTRVVDELLKTEIDNNEVASILQNMKEDGSFEDINYDDLSRTAGFPHRRHTYDLVYLAKAYQTPNSKHYKSESIKAAITRSLKYWVTHDFFGDNWHNNQISTPTNLVNLMLLIGEEMPKELVDKAQPMIGRAHMNASGARPSGDRIVIAGILAKNLLFMGDNEQFEEIVKLIEGEIKFSTGKRGMQHDYSFHHRKDRVNNTDSYGYGKYANNFGEWSYYVANTKYTFSEDKIQQLIDYYLDGIYKQLVYGVYQDVSVKNRSITHKQSFVAKGTVEIERLLQSTDYRKDELEEILRLRKGESKPSQSFAKFFWQTEHFVFQRPDFYTTVRMFSTRNRNMEVPYNGPGKVTHHRADGTNYLVLKGDEYLNIWPAYDWQKVSGTTVMQKPKLYGPKEIQKDGLTEFVGAVTDGMYGAVGFDFRSPHDPVKARKSWFFFDEEYVCLGSGIRGDRQLPVATTINQVLMKGSVNIMQNGSLKNLSQGQRKMEDVKWVHHDKIGYILPEPSKINIMNQTEQGRWSDLTDQKNISTELVDKDVFMLWFDHGKRPDSASYEYIVVPNVSVEELQRTASNNRGLSILSNTPELQAVKHEKLELVQLVFYSAGKVGLSPNTQLRMESQGMAMVKMTGDDVREISLSDPSRKLNRIMLSLSGIYKINTEGVTSYIDEQKQTTLLIVDLPQGVYRGKSVTIEF